MHVDHILPTNKADINDEEVKQYIEELEKDGFIQDSIENYLPVCSACNLKKSNHVFKQFTGDISGIYSGMTGQASFGVQSEDDVLYVSNQAVYQDGTEIYVQILEDNGEITKQKVTTGFSDGRNVEIVSGLEEGQKVIIESKVAS